MKLALIAVLLLLGAGGGHVLMTQAPQSPWAVALLLGPMATLTTLWLWRAGQRLLAAAIVVVLMALAWAMHQRHLQPETLYVAQHVGAHLALAAWFWSTLRGTPLIVQVARRVHALTPTMRAYATHVTRAWVIYFVAMASVSIALYLLAPFSRWSFFANVLTPVAVVVMFAGEHWFRYRRHPEFERVTMRVAVNAWRNGPPGPG